MRISLASPVDVGDIEVGWGQAATNIYWALIALGHTVTLNDATAPVQLNWMQPHLFRPNRYQYHILMFPWESTEFHQGWTDICNSDYIQEVWTTSNFCKKIFEDNGVDKEVKVFEHGINSIWTPKLRVKEGPLKYLIVDAAANRKGWQEAFDAFRSVFQDDKTKATLTIKSRQTSLIKWKDDRNRFRNPKELPNVDINLDRLPDEEMVELFHDHDVLIFPSAGEGYGLIPHQALASGMPSIVTAEWAPYRDWLGDLALRSNYGATRWPGEHPGEVCWIEQAHLEELIKLVYDDFDNQSKKFFGQSFAYHENYDWQELTKKAFEDIDKKF